MGIKLIGIHGKAGAGKDTFGQFLVEECGFHRMAFADPVKQAAAAIFGWPVELLHDTEFKKTYSDFWKISVRQAIQKTGTEAVRGTFGDDHWVNRWIMEYVKYEKTTSVVVTDVREETEANAIRGLGGVIVHLLRDGAGLDGAEGAHSSEKGITFNVKHDIYISNNRTLADLHCEAIHLIKSIESYTAENPGSKIKNSLQQA